jgi:NADPH-dependent 2,4-dienoyl-CoA reductase/sulfur reductase-like enzyme/rhodanese-related sulfurtransferase
MANTKQRIVIIGGVACGPKAAARARRLDPDAEITIIEQGSVLSYAGCGMPYYIKGSIGEMHELMSTPVGVPRNADFFRDVKGVNVYTGTEVVDVNHNKKVVRCVNLETGKHMEFLYDKLVLATGSYSLKPKIHGIDMDYVFGLREPRHASAIRDAVTSGKVKQVVIVGGGLIGLEMSEALAAQGMEVSLVEKMPFILPNLLDEEMSAFLTRHLLEKGINVYTGEELVSIEGVLGEVKHVLTKSHKLPADMVLISLGVRPRVELAEQTGLDIGPHGGILVNEKMETSLPGIYAGGDCVECKHLITGQWAYVPLGSTANKHGRVIGTNLVGGNETFPGILGTCIVKVFDYNVGRTGLTERQAREQGYDVVTILAPGPDRAHYYPGFAIIVVKLIADASSRKVLGVQIVGPGDVSKRLDVAATAMRFGATVDDMGTLDLGYAPPYSEAIDNIIQAANIMRNKIDGIAQAVTPSEVKSKIDKGGDFIFLDVRTQKEHDSLCIDAPNVRLIPLGLLRKNLEHLPKDKEIVTFCKVSLRGYEAFRILKSAGFNKVAFMDGGVITWPYELKKAV